MTTNQRRAARAEVAIEAYAREEGLTEDSNAIADLLADLMHWMDTRHGDNASARIAFNEYLQRAREYYDEEIASPYDSQNITA